MTLRWMHELSASDLALHDEMLRQTFRLPLPPQARRSVYENPNPIFQIVPGWDDGLIFPGAPKLSKVEERSLVVRIMRTADSRTQIQASTSRETPCD